MRNGIKHSLFALGLSLSALTAQAQDPEAGEVGVSESTSVSTDGSARSTGSRGPLRVYGGFHIGGGGNTKTMRDGNSAKTDMGFLGGLQGGVDYVIHPYVALGGEFRFTRTRVDIDIPTINIPGVPQIDVDKPKISILDFVFKPRGRYEFSNIPLEVYGTLPLGFDLVIPKNGDTKFNMNFGIGGGAMYFFTERMGVNTELTGIFHWYRSDGGPAGDFRNRIGQFYWFNNFVFVL